MKFRNLNYIKHIDVFGKGTKVKASNLKIQIKPIDTQQNLF